MIRSILFFMALTISVIFTSCIDGESTVSDDDLTNSQIMSRLDIVDAGIWNTLCTQSIGEDETEDSTDTKSALGKVREYPSGDDYYFALFEDLYPSEGDYDFNDVMLRTKLGWGKSGSTHEGYIATTLINKGGSLPVNVGLMFYVVSGNTYTRIPYEDITVNGTALTDEPWTASLDDLGTEWEITYQFENKSANIWISYFLEVQGDKILTGGFAPVDVEEFKIPRYEYLSDDYLPWGLEIETSSLAIPNEKELFLNAYPEFEAWAESGGTKNKKWYQSPDLKYSFY